MKGIRQRLLIWQITALVITGVLASVLTYQMAWSGFNRVRDYGLQQIAYSVVRHGVRTPPTKPNAPPPTAPAAEPATGASAATPSESDDDAASGDPAEDLGQFVSQIWSPKGKLIYSSIDDTGPPLQEAGMHIVDWDGESWRVYTLPDRNQVVQVAVSAAGRANRFSAMVPWLLVPLALLVLVLALLNHTTVTRALAPLDALGRDIGRREVSQLHAVQTQSLPEELVPLGEALNQLLARVEALLSGQRRLLADAAHELNTPLAAIKLQAQLARRATEQQREAALDELDQGIERATHLVAQLLQMARLEPEAREREPTGVRVDTLAARVVAALSAQAEARDIDLGLERSDVAEVWGDAPDLRALLDNLVENALRHAPPGSRVDVKVEKTDQTVALEVSDNGPGIAPEDRERVLQRFVRLNPQDSTGSGLGLAIVARIVEQHGGTLTLTDSPAGGLRVRAVFAAHPGHSG